MFAMNLWNFRRLHPSDFSPDLIGRLIDRGPGGHGGQDRDRPTGLWRGSHRSSSATATASSSLTRSRPARPCGSATTACGGWARPTTRRWPVRCRVTSAFAGWPLRGRDGDLLADASDPPSGRRGYRRGIRGTSLVHRLVWKYQGWLLGFNGGPIRSPHHRINDRQMATLRAAAVASGLPMTDDPDSAFSSGATPDDTHAARRRRSRLPHPSTHRRRGRRGVASAWAQGALGRSLDCAGRRRLAAYHERRTHRRGRPWLQDLPACPGARRSLSHVAVSPQYRGAAGAARRQPPDRRAHERGRGGRGAPSLGDGAGPTRGDRQRPPSA